MKQYDLNGFQGGLASIGAYFGIVFIFLIGIGTVYLQVYYYSIQ